MPRAILLYHFFHPDDVVSARQFSDLALGLSASGHEVLALPCNRTWDNKRKLSESELWSGGEIRRLWRPAWAQSSNRGRFFNSLWMLAAWTWQALILPRSPNDVVIIGTDPLLAVLVAWPWKLLRPGSRVAHWCFDLYPEAAVADGLLRPSSKLNWLLRKVLKGAYHRCDVLADIGPCMQKLLKVYDSPAAVATITPWALVEPAKVVEPDAIVRAALFGPNTRIGVLYSGSFGRAHSYIEFLTLARHLRKTGIEFCFAGRGNRADELKAAVEPNDTNIRFAGFASEAELELRLTACDFHLVSLNADWTGTVVPSKFFGALAVGRGVLFAGSAESGIARWILEHNVGWVLDSAESIERTATELERFAANPAQQAELRERCFAVYHRYFSQSAQIEKWVAVLNRR